MYVLGVIPLQGMDV